MDNKKSFLTLSINNDENFYTLIEQIKLSAPYQKVLILFCEKDYLVIKDLSLALKRVGNKCFFICLKKDEKLNVDMLSKLFCMPEDIRAVITLSPSLIKIADYVCSLKNITSIAFNCQLNFSNLCPLVMIENGKFNDVYNANCKKVLILSKKNLPKKPELYALILHIEFCLFDYYTRCFFSNQIFDFNAVNKVLTCLNTIKEQILNGFEQIDYNEVFAFLSMLFCIDRSLNGELFSFCLSNFIQMLLGKNFSFSKKLFIDKSVFNKIFHLLDSKHFPTDYNNAVANSSKAFLVSEDFARQNLIKMLSNFSNIEKTKIKSYLLKLNNAKKYFEKSICTYCFLGGKRISILPSERQLMDDCAYNPYGKINLLTVAKELCFIV